MAMQKTIDFDGSGNELNYHRISRVSYSHDSKSGQVYISSYVSQDTRAGGKQRVGDERPLPFSLEDLPDPVEPTRENIYNFLSTQENGLFFQASKL